MVLFKLDRQVDRNNTETFTFHYGPIQIGSLTDYAKDNNIYIPLWSYSNELEPEDSGADTIFTFHYGPIQIVTNSSIIYLLSPFTFHYGPIQMLVQLHHQFQHLYLHSTMVLFKWNKEYKT